MSATVAVHYAPPLGPPNNGAGSPLHPLTPDERANDRIDADAAHATCDECLRLIEVGHARSLPLP